MFPLLSLCIIDGVNMTEDSFCRVFGCSPAEITSTHFSSRLQVRLQVLARLADQASTADHPALTKLNDAPTYPHHATPLTITDTAWASASCARSTRHATPSCTCRCPFRSTGIPTPNSARGPRTVSPSTLRPLLLRRGSPRHAAGAACARGLLSWA